MKAPSFNKSIKRFIKNVLALVGLVTVIAAGVLAYQFNKVASALDPEAVAVYKQAAQRFLLHLDPGEAMVLVVPAQPGLTPEEVISSLKSLSVNSSMLFTAETRFSDHIQNALGKAYNFISILSFCNIRTGAMLASYNYIYTAFMPCRIAVVQDPRTQRVYLLTLDMDLLIHGGKSLPPDLKAAVSKVRDTLRSLMLGAAQGEF